MRVHYPALVALAWSVTATPAPPQYDPATACALVSSSAASQLAASPKAIPMVDAKLGYDCLTSVPLHALEAEQLVRSIYPFIEFQSTIEYVKNPPEGYFWPAVDLRAGLDTILENVRSGAYQTEHEFLDQLWRLMNSVHDSNFQYLPDLIFKAIAFQRPLPIVSVSFDGVSSPKVYAYRDILLSRKSSFVPSALATIDGKAASRYIEDMSQLASMHDPDAAYNMMFISPAFTGRNKNWRGLFGGSGWFYGLYPGAHTSITFENGTELVVENQAAIIGNFTGVTDGESFYQRFCAAIPTTSPHDKPMPSGTLSTGTIPNGYPKPRIISKDRLVAGYYLPNSDVAVLAIYTFEAADSHQFQSTVQQFIYLAFSEGKKKLVVDLSGNGGGSALLAVDVFRQLFPYTVQDGNTRLRRSPEFLAIAEQISGFFPPGFNPYQSNDDLLLRAWTLPVNYQTDLSLVNKGFQSFQDKFEWPMTEYNGDNFTNIIRWDLGDPLITVNKTYGLGIHISGYGWRANSFWQPFAASDVVMVHDGYCSSACSLLTEFMSTHAGVKSIAFGGRPKPDASAETPLIQSVGGSKGISSYSYNTLHVMARLALYHKPSLGQQLLLNPMKSTVAQSRSTHASVNMRDSILKENLEDGLPSQFSYQPADCRLFYTPAMMANVSAIWEAAVNTAWGAEKCVAGSLPGSNAMYRRDVEQDVQWETEVVDLGGPAPESSESWLEKYLASHGACAAQQPDQRMMGLALEHDRARGPRPRLGVPSPVPPPSGIWRRAGRRAALSPTSREPTLPGRRAVSLRPAGPTRLSKELG
ncbi:hypothetical protein JHW43_005654 [Diplocarpon mali]|nr:hypothetical protein JHW43_005654 [Diplocarpon mali]